MSTFSASHRLKLITPGATDNDIGKLIADAMTELEREPYCYAINHNAGAPHYLACPLPYDWTWTKFVGIETQDKAVAMNWIERAVRIGYEVSMAGTTNRRSLAKVHQPYGTTMSLALARTRAARYQAPAPTDEDIPF